MPPTITAPVLATRSVALATRSDSDALPFVDSGRGSSIPSKQGSQGAEEAVVSTRRRVELRDSKKRKLREIARQLSADHDSGDEIDPDLGLEVLTEGELELGSISEEELEPRVPVQKNKRFCIGVRPPSFVYPKSQYEGHKHSLPKEKEWLVVKELLVSGNAVV